MRQQLNRREHFSASVCGDLRRLCQIFDIKSKYKLQQCISVKHMRHFRPKNSYVKWL